MGLRRGRPRPFKFIDMEKDFLNFLYEIITFAGLEKQYWHGVSLVCKYANITNSDALQLKKGRSPENEQFITKKLYTILEFSFQKHYSQLVEKFEKEGKFDYKTKRHMKKGPGCINNRILIMHLLYPEGWPEKPVLPKFLHDYFQSNDK